MTKNYSLAKVVMLFLALCAAFVAMAQNQATVTLKTDAAVGTKIRLYMQPYNQQNVVGLTAGEFMSEYIVDNPNEEITITGKLTQLECYGAQLTELMVEAPELQILKCYNNKLTNLDVSECPELARLECNDNKLTALDISANPLMEELRCQNNALTALTIGTQPEMRRIDCFNNKLAGLDVSGCLALSSLYVQKNQLTTIDLSNNAKLDYIYLFGNKIGETNMGVVMAKLPNVGSGMLYIVDTRDAAEQNVCKMAHVAAAGEKGWATCDYLGGTDSGYMTGTFYYGADYEPVVEGGKISMTTTKAVGETITIELSAGEGDITIDGVAESGPYVGQQTLTPTSQLVTINGSLTKFVANGNKLTSLSVENQNEITWIECSNNSIESLNLSNLVTLTTVICNNNALKSFTLSGCTALTRVECYQNDIKGTAMTALVKSLPEVAPGAAAIRIIDTMATNPADRNICVKANVKTAKDKGWNVIDNIDGGRYGMGQTYEGSDPIVAPGEAVVTLKTDAAVGTKIRLYMQPYNQQNVVGLTAGEFMSEYIVDNPNEEITITGKLTQLECYGAQLTELMVEAPELQILKCYNNKLTNLDVSECPELARLECNDNKLTALDISANPLMEELRCQNNSLTVLNIGTQPEMRRMDCFNNKLTGLDVSGCLALSSLYVQKNQLTTIDLSNNAKLDYIYLFGNKIGETNMGVVMAKLPNVGSGMLYIVDTRDAEEQNVCKMSHVAVAGEKGWLTCDYLGGIDNGYMTGTFYYGADYEPVVKGGKISMTTTKAVGETITIELSAGEGDITIDGVAESGPYVGQQTLTPTSQLVTINGSLTKIVANGNKLTSLSVENQNEITWIECSNNSIESLNLYNSATLTTVICNNNALKSFTLSGCKALTRVECYQNDISGIAMTALVKSLPEVAQGTATIRIIDTMATNPADRNICVKANVKTAKDKGWEVIDNIDGGRYGMGQTYEGSEPIVDKTKYFAYTSATPSVVMFKIALADSDAEPFVEGGELVGWNGEALSVQMTGDKVFVYADITEIVAPMCNFNTIDISTLDNLAYLNVLLNDLTEIDLSQNAKLDYIDCSFNKIQTLDVSACLLIRTIVCNGNDIHDDGMDAMIQSLPQLTKTDHGSLYILDSTVSDDMENICTENQVNACLKKYWAVFDLNNGDPVQYFGATDGIENTLNDKETAHYDMSANTLVFTEKQHIEVYNMSGINVLTVDSDRVDLSSLQTGIYIVRTEFHTLKIKR